MSTTIELQLLPSVQPAATSVTITQDSESATPTAQPRPLRVIRTIENLYVHYERAAEHVQKYISGWWLKLHALVEAIWWNCAWNCTGALEHLRASLLKCWPKLTSSLSAIRHKYTPSSWLGVIIALVIGGASLRYAYVSIRLGVWTASKDFHEYCQSLKVSAFTLSLECEMALQEPIPPPPYMNPGDQKRSHWGHVMLQSEVHTYRILTTVDMPNEDLSAGMNFLLLFPYIAVVGSLICLQIRRRIRSLLSSCLRNPLAPSSSTVVPNAQSVRIEPAPNMSEETIQYSTSVPSPSTRGLRRQKGGNLTPNSTIWKAAEAGDVEEIERNLESGVDVNAYSESHGTPLSVAAYSERNDVVEMLLSRNAKVNGCHAGYHENALHSAAERGYETIVRSLLKHGANINAEVSDVSPVYVASLKGRWSIIQILLDLGAEKSALLKPTRSVFQRVVAFSL